MKKETLIKNSYVGVCAMGCLLLLIQVVMSPRVPIYDEIVFHPNLLLYQNMVFRKSSY